MGCDLAGNSRLASEDRGAMAFAASPPAAIGERSYGFGARARCNTRRRATTAGAGRRRAAVRCAEKGFGPAATAEAAWAKEYNAYVRRNGEALCAMAFEGYQRLGRGAVFANYDRESANVGVATMGGGGGGGGGGADGKSRVSASRPSFYVSEKELVARNAGDSVAQMGPILSRIGAYDPLKQFVVVFECGGTQGADVVTPNMAPEDVWRFHKAKHTEAKAKEQQQ